MNIKTGIYRTEHGLTVYLGKDAPKCRVWLFPFKRLRDMGVPSFSFSIGEKGRWMLLLMRKSPARKRSWAYVLAKGGNWGVS